MFDRKSPDVGWLAVQKLLEFYLVFGRSVAPLCCTTVCFGVARPRFAPPPASWRRPPDTFEDAPHMFRSAEDTPGPGQYTVPESLAQKDSCPIARRGSRQVHSTCSQTRTGRGDNTLGLQPSPQKVVRPPWHPPQPPLKRRWPGALGYEQTGEIVWMNGCPGCPKDHPKCCS